MRKRATPPPTGKAFAWPERKSFPVHDKASVEQSAKALSDAKDLSPGQRSRIAARLSEAGNLFGIKLDLAPSDVHAPGLMAPKKSRITVRGSLGEGGSIHVRHHLTNAQGQHLYMLDAREGAEQVYLLEHLAIEQGEEVSPASVGVKLNGPDTYSDGKAVTLRWVMLAIPGAWRGHGSGPFALTTQTFAEIKANFEKRQIPVMFDLNHLSESDPTEGTMPPEERAKAWGWTHRLKIEGGKLWGLVEWLDATRQMIAKGELKYVSPAFSLASKDSVTGLQQGARLKSAAVTNNPFLSTMPGLIAATVDGVTHSNSHEFMPHVRACLKCSEMADPTECSEALDKLRTYHKLGDGKACQGVDVPAMTGDMRRRLCLPMTMSDDDMFDQVQAMIDSAIAEHEAKFHGVGGSQKLDEDGGDDGGGEDDGEMTMTLEEALKKIGTLEANAAASEVALTAARDKADKAEALVVKLTADTAELAALRLAAVAGEVDEVCANYSVKPEHRDVLLTQRQNDPAGFAKMYPKKNPAERVRQTHMTKVGERTADTVALTHESGRTKPSVVNGVVKLRHDDDPADVTDAVMLANPHLSFGAAQVEAQKLLTAAERTNFERESERG